MIVNYSYLPSPTPGVAITVSDGKRCLSMVEPLEERYAAAWIEYNRSGLYAFESFLDSKKGLKDSYHKSADILASALDTISLNQNKACISKGLLEYAVIFLGRINAAESPRRHSNFGTLIGKLREFTAGMGCDDIALSEIDGNTIGRFVGFLETSGLMNTTVATYIRLLKALYNAAVREGVMPDAKPFGGMQLHALDIVPRPLGSLLTDADVDTLRHADLAGLDGLETARRILLTAYETGLNLSQILDLKPSQLLTEGLLYGTRLIPVSAELRQVLSSDSEADYCFYPSASLKGRPRDKKKLERRYEGRRIALARRLGMMPRLSIVGLLRLRKLAAAG